MTPQPDFSWVFEQPAQAINYPKTVALIVFVAAFYYIALRLLRRA